MDRSIEAKTALSPAFSALSALLAILTVGGGVAEASSLAEVRERGKLIVLSVPHMESDFVATNLEAGPMRREGGTVEHFVGRDVDLMAIVAERLGVSLEIRPAIGREGLPSYSALIPQLLEGEGDVITSSFSITAERRKRVDYTVPYLTIRPVVVVRKGTEAASFSDLEGKRAAAVPGSSQEEHLISQGFADSIQEVQYSLQSYNALSEGKVDFILVDSGSANLVLPRYDDLRVAFELQGSEDYGIAVAPGSDLREAINEILEDLRKSGELTRIYQEERE